LKPIVPILNHYLGIEFPSEATLNLGVVMTKKTQDGEVFIGVVAWVLIYVVDLHCAASIAANTTSVIRSK